MSVKSSKLPQLIKTNGKDPGSFISTTREDLWQGAKSQYLSSTPSQKKKSSEHYFSSHFSELSSSKQNILTNHHSDEKFKLNNYNGSFKQASTSKICQSSESSRSCCPKYLNHDTNCLKHQTNLNSSNSDSNISLEMMFLIREHSKTLATVNKISKRLEELEKKVDDISKGVFKVEACSSSTLKEGESNSAALILSDDSGGEYSRTTGTTIDDDELLSLLQQITKCSHQIKQTQEAQINQNQILTNSLNRVYSRPFNQVINEPQNGSAKLEFQTFSNSSIKPQSLSALLSEPSSDRFLNNVYQMMEEKNSLFSNSGSNLISNLSQVSMLQSMPASSPNDTLYNQINHAQNLIEKKRQVRLESQFKKAEEWFANQLVLKAHDNQIVPRHNNKAESKEALLMLKKEKKRKETKKGN